MPESFFFHFSFFVFFVVVLFCFLYLIFDRINVFNRSRIAQSVEHLTAEREVKITEK